MRDKAVAAADAGGELAPSNYLVCHILNTSSSNATTSLVFFFSPKIDQDSFSFHDHFIIERKQKSKKHINQHFATSLLTTTHAQWGKKSSCVICLFGSHLSLHSRYAREAGQDENDLSLASLPRRCSAHTRTLPPPACIAQKHQARETVLKCAFF